MRICLRPCAGSLLIPFCALAGIARADVADLLPVPAEVTPRDGVCAVANPVREVVDPSLGLEAYVLTVSPTGVEIRSANKVGAYWARQTLAQLAWGRTDYPCVVIRDAPRFPWRGIMVDASRHFVPIDEVKRTIDHISRWKLNVYHWHLVDTHGWRMEVPNYPKLTSVAAWRMQPGYPEEGRCERYGGFYTTAEMRDVVAYAAARGVTVVPEIEIPGHCAESLVAYPEYACDGQSFFQTETFKTYPCHKLNFNPCGCNAYCAGKEKTYQFLQDILDEVMRIFPSEYIHVGGDEVSLDYWRGCASCRKLMEREGMKDVNEIQPYFMRRVVSYLAAHGRKAIGWDEVSETSGLPAGTAIQSWRGWGGDARAIDRGFPIVASTQDELYLDRGQAPDSNEPEHWPGYNPIDEIYAFEPVPTGRDPRFVLGIEGPLWTIFTHTQKLRDIQTWPRLLAIAETGWSRREKKDFKDFTRRQAASERALAALDVKYWHANWREPTDGRIQPCDQKHQPRKD